MALQVLFLLLCLFLGQESEVRAQLTAAQPNAAPDTPVALGPSNITFGTWNVTLRNSNLTILTSPNGIFSFNLLLTNQSISSCAAVVQHNSSKVTIWVANFNATNSGSGISMCILNFTKDGLVLSSRNAIGIQNLWSSTNSLTEEDFDLLELNDSGNLIMTNNSSKSRWDSFARPTDTLVNGQTLNRFSIPLSAALLNSEYSNGGIFYMRIDASDVTLSQDFKYNGISLPMPYNSFSYENLTLVSIYMNKTLQVNGTDSSTGNIISISNGSLSTGNSVWDYARLESNGGLVLKRFDSQEQNETLYPSAGAAYCSLPAQCGSFGICSGANDCGCPVGFAPLNSTTDFTCGRTEDLNMSDCTRDQFFNVTGRTYVNLAYLNFSEADHILPQDCEIRCNSSCDCTNALHVRRNVTSQRGACLINPTSMQTVTRDLNGLQRWFLRIPPDVVVVPAPLPGAGSSTKSSRRTAASAFAGGAGAVLLVLLGLSFCWLFHSRRKLFDDADRGNIDSASMSLSQLPPQFSYEELEASTSNFNRRLGYGGFSSVYAGHLPDNSKIAVKILDDNGHPKEKEFLASMATVGGLSHPNLVPLRGFCSEGKHRMLVYELVNEGRSLNYFLFRPDSGPLMDSQTRRSIALETARGLAYLHEDMVIHGGVKPENIMIDREMHPRLVDYGLTNLMSRFQKLNFANERGSRAYMAPEWARSPPVTEKVDVYSFGVVLLELVSGRSCLILSGVPEEKRFLPTWGFSVLRRGPDHLLELADPRLDIRSLSESDQQVLMGMTFIALWCVQEDPSKRPAMSQVVKMLDGDIPVNAPPLSPALDALATELCAGHGHGHGAKPEGARFMNSPSVSENSEMRPR